MSTKGYTLPSHVDMVENICAVLDSATAEDWAAGVAWYPAARRIAGALGREVGLSGRRSYEVGAGVLAALSPSCEWDRNIAAAWAVVRHRARIDEATVQSEVNVQKAVRVLDGVAPLDALGGSKVRSFFVCILNPSDAYSVCIDRHAVAVALGGTLSSADTQKAARGHRYELIAEAYRAVGAARGLTPSVVQAITWVTWRRLKAEN